MQKKDFSLMPCPIARGLSKVGEWWSILILRDCFYGETRFDGFQKSLGIAPNMLTRRLTDLVEAGLLERRAYCAKPPRYEYLLTAAGRDFMPVLLTLGAWGNKHFSPDGKAVVLRDEITGHDVRMGLVDMVSGRAIDNQRHALVPGPTATENMRRRLERAAEKRAAARLAAAA
jgi:DNA-binding HxlR family transcriptional regulator